MHLVADSLDDLMRAVLSRLLEKGRRLESTKGSNAELTGVLLEIRQPIARLSRTEVKGTVFSCLGETLWYFAGSDRLDFIAHYVRDYKDYSDNGRTVHGAYGPRLFKMRGRVNQIASVTSLLKKKPGTRQAVIQLFNAEDILKVRKDIPCTCTLQFMIRNKRLDLITHMRSNDAFLGLPHDVFAFTFIQEVMARSLGVTLGTYRHFVGSLHLYDRNTKQARTFLNEGWQDSISMPPMPEGDPWPHIRKVLAAEEIFRTGRRTGHQTRALPRYWADLVRLLQVFANTGRKSVIRTIREQMASDAYNTYIDRRAEMSVPKLKKGFHAPRRQRTSSKAGR